MKSAKAVFKIFALFQVVVVTAGCGGGGGSGGESANSAASSTTLVSITLSPSNPTVQIGKSTVFVATGHFSDGSVANLASATWSSSAANVANISNAAGSKGMATALAAGTTTITAATPGVSGTTSLTTTVGTSLANVMSISVNGSLCSSATSINYLNKPCVSVTICNPGTAICQTVNDILLDTGSYGLRIFKQATTGLALPQVTSGSGSLAGCVQFVDGTSLWGPIQTADVQLANEPAVKIPIQVIDASFATRPSSCANAAADPLSAGFTGILGVGTFNEDCGAGCVGSTANGIYFQCTGSSCRGAAVSLADQVQNPVAHLPNDNNGVVVQLPAVPLGGVPSASGTLVLGIGTQSNNGTVPSTVLPTDLNGDFLTTFQGANVTGFLDTGSNGLFFPNINSALPICFSPDAEWYCPPVTRALLATTVGAFASSGPTASFNVGNFTSLMNSPNNVFSELAGPSAVSFDWGLPFFMGRNVFLGLEGKSGLGSTGPYVAY
jgi:hypothetical protein